MPGAEPWSHHGAGPHGALCLHGFTGNPSSMRGVAEAFAAAGFHVELPLLPGHGTAVEDMLGTRWADWAAEAMAAYGRLSARADAVVVAGLSMGGTLALHVACEHPEVAAVVCINPAAQPQPPEVMEMVHAMVAEGHELLPGTGPDIADPEGSDLAYDGTPLRSLISMVEDGVGPLAARLPACEVPLLLITSRRDHVVDPLQSDYLAEHWGGAVERLTLERSYHVATQDFDRELVNEAAVAFARRVTAR